VPECVCERESVCVSKNGFSVMICGFECVRVRVRVRVSLCV